LQFDGSLNFDTKIDTSGITSGLAKISTLAKQGAKSLASLSLNGLKTSGEKALEVVSKIANVGLDSLSTSIKTATAGLTAFTGGMGAVVGKSVEIGQTFESSMAQVLATMGKTKDSMATLNGQDVNIYDTLSDKAKELGASTQFSASEVADAFNYMALAGWDVEKQLASIDGILDLSAASGLELGETCDIVTDYLSAFGMASSESGKMADMMAYAQSNANLSVSNLAESWKNCAANMTANGQSIETTTALLSKMADQGFKGSEAGTALSAIVRDMSNAMENGAIKIGDTAVAVADAQGNYRDLTDIITDVEKAVGSMSETERTTAFSTSFTADSIKGMNLLLNAGADNIKEFEKNLSDMAKIEGFASKSAQTMNDNLEGDMKSLASASEGVYNAIYDKLSPSLRELAQNGTKYLQEFNQALNTDGSQGMIDFAQSVGDVLVEALEDNQQLLQNATAMGTTLINSLIDGIRKNEDKIVANVVSSIKQGLTAGEDVFTNFYNLGFRLVSSIGDGLAENPEVFTDLVSDFISSISSTFTRYSSKLSKSGTTILKAVFKGVSKSARNVSKDITTLVGDIAEIFVEETPEFITIGTDIIVALLSGIQDGMKNNDVSTDDVINTIATGLENNGDILLDCAWTLLSAFGRGIGANLPKLSQHGLDIVLALTDFIGENADEIGDGAVDLITALADTLITEDNLKRISDTAIKLISNFATGLTSGDNMTKISETANDVVKAVADTLFDNSIGGSGVNDVLSAGAFMGGQLLSGLSTALFNENGGVFKILDTLVTSVGTYLSENFWSLGTMVMEGFMSGVTGVDFSFEEFGEYMYDTTHSGHYWSDYFSGLGTALQADNTTSGEVEAYYQRMENLGLDDYTQNFSKLSEAVESNTSVSAQLDTATTSFAEALGAFNKSQENKQTTVSLYLYPNSEAFDTAILDSQNRLISSSGGHIYGN
jgi:TP901 family phage tail tape measure protein